MFKITIKKNGLNNEKRSVANLSKKIFVPKVINPENDGTQIITTNYNDDTSIVKPKDISII